MLEHPREYRIFAEVALGIINLLGFELLGTQSKNFMIHFFISTINTTVYAGKKELLKIFIKACKSARLLVHGRWLLYVQQKSNLYFFNALFSCRGSGGRSPIKILIQALKDKF